MSRKFFQVLLAVIMAIALFSCGEAEDSKQTDTLQNLDESDTQSFAESDTETSIESDTEEVTKSSYIHFLPPPNELLLGENMIVVEWGEAVPSIVTKWDNYYEGLFCGITVKYVKIFERTMREGYLENPEERFEYVENGDLLSETYDDIILVPEVIASTLNKGDRALIQIFDKKLEFDRVDITYYGVGYTEYSNNTESTDDYRYGFFPFVNDLLVVPENTCEQGGAFLIAYPVMENILNLNNYLKKADESYPIFESGITFEELERYFELVFDPGTFNIY